MDKQAKTLLDGDYTFNVVQVKSKFGGLRFYVNQASDEIYDLIHDAEEKAEITCERCGEPGIIRTDRWAICLCDKCLDSIER